MIRLYGNCISLSDNEKKELALLKEIFGYGVRKIIYNKPKLDEAISFSAWTIDDSKDDIKKEKSFFGTIEGSTAQFIYSIVQDHLKSCGGIFLLQDIIHECEKDNKPEVTAKDILLKYLGEGAREIEIQYYGKYRAIVYHNHSYTRELNPFETAVIAQNIQFDGKRYRTTIKDLIETIH